MNRLADRAAQAVARRVDRRSFLTRTALVGTALAVAPVDYSLKPTSAYAAICGCSGSRCQCGSLCCDGYTEFCCTLTGLNSCPPGTISAGWWKVDGSQFCGGAARYYMDCNAQCGPCGCGAGGVCSGACSGTRCGCAKGDCNNRKSGCVQFRYGQCHQEIPCVGPIVCRIVTCTPPWLFDPACGTASRTDNATRNHDRPCADRPFGAVDGFSDAGSAVRVSGWAIDPPGDRSLEVRVAVDTLPVVTVGADLNRPDVGAVYRGFGSAHGFDVTVPAPPGQRLVCVIARDPRSGRAAFLSAGVVNVTGVAGSYDSASSPAPGLVRAEGWAFDPVAPRQAITVELRVDGVVVASAPAAGSRPDVGAAYPVAGPDHGFTLEATVAAGARSVCVDAVSVRGVRQELGCATVNVE